MTDRTEPRDPLDLIDLPKPSPPLREEEWVPSPELLAYALLAILLDAQRRGRLVDVMTDIRWHA